MLAKKGSGLEGLMFNFSAKKFIYSGDVMAWLVCHSTLALHSVDYKVASSNELSGTQTITTSPPVLQDSMRV